MEASSGDQGVGQLLVQLRQNERAMFALCEEVIQQLYVAGLSLVSLARDSGDLIPVSDLDTTVDQLDATINHIRRFVMELHLKNGDSSDSMSG